MDSASTGIHYEMSLKKVAAMYFIIQTFKMWVSTGPWDARGTVLSVHWCCFPGHRGRGDTRLAASCVRRSP